MVLKGQIKAGPSARASYTPTHSLPTSMLHLHIHVLLDHTGLEQCAVQVAEQLDVSSGELHGLQVAGGRDKGVTPSNMYLV